MPDFGRIAEDSRVERDLGRAFGTGYEIGKEMERIGPISSEALPENELKYDQASRGNNLSELIRSMDWQPSDPKASNARSSAFCLTNAAGGLHG